MPHSCCLSKISGISEYKYFSPNPFEMASRDTPFDMQIKLLMIGDSGSPAYIEGYDLFLTLDYF